VCACNIYIYRYVYVAVVDRVAVVVTFSAADRAVDKVMVGVRVRAGGKGQAFASVIWI
jgi:hypothetical protein